MEEVVTGESDDQKRHLPFPSVKILHIGFHLYSWSARRTRRTNAVKIKEKKQLTLDVWTKRDVKLTNTGVLTFPKRGEGV